jgi:hypothetical protein
MKKPKFPQFDAYACIGDSITWHKDGFDLTATLEHDQDSHVDDSEWYSPIKIKQWKNDDWFFVGVVISVSKNNIELLDHAASIWGTECNFNKRSNRHLAGLAQDMESEAISAAKVRITEICNVLCEV